MMGVLRGGGRERVTAEGWLYGTKGVGGRRTAAVLAGQGDVAGCSARAEVCRRQEDVATHISACGMRGIRHGLVLVQRENELKRNCKAGDDGGVGVSWIKVRQRLGRDSQRTHAEEDVIRLGYLFFPDWLAHRLRYEN
jgi:hypothetical protein